MQPWNKTCIILKVCLEFGWRGGVFTAPETDHTFRRLPCVLWPIYRFFNHLLHNVLSFLLLSRREEVLAMPPPVLSQGEPRPTKPCVETGAGWATRLTHQQACTSLPLGQRCTEQTLSSHKVKIVTSSLPSNICAGEGRTANGLLG